MQRRVIFTRKLGAGDKKIKKKMKHIEYKVSVKSYTVNPAFAIREVAVTMETQHVIHGNMHHHRRRRRSFRPR